MSHLFPPSSPVADKSLESPQKGIGKLPNASVLTLGRKRSICEPEEYPTPDPSSSIGRHSSPVKEITSHLDEAGSTYALSSPSKQGKKLADPIKIELDPSDPSRLAIGRKKSVCNVILPCRKNISRQHAFISYVADRNEIKLECNGTNGLSVHLPCSVQLYLIKPFQTRNFYKLMTEEPLTPQNAKLSHAKILQKNQNFISFVLAKGETVTFPYIQGTLVNFTGATVCLSLKEIARFSEDGNINFNEENSTETEDELCLLTTKSDDFPWQEETPSMKFVPVEHSPRTEQISKPLLIASPILVKNSPISHRTTPQTSFVINQPSTPRKLKRKSISLKNNTIQETPLPKDKGIGTSSASTRRDSIIEQQTLNVVAKKTNELSSVTTNVPPPCKRFKTSLNSNPEIFRSLTERGIRCDDLVHVLCNHLAFSNLQQTPLSQLQNINSNTSQLSKDELRRVLEAISCIGIIVRAGKDASGKALEDEYYYDVENDDSDERKILYNSLRGRSRLRSCRKKHKQYFWKKPTK
ncbi:Plm2p [Saccharomyces paradoxus]|uniref:Plm2p n=1 Tax=Saccharomyces paradoxus TaxID=27291 RepID=A0A8B8UPL7_SACPA|nr:Plm2 [Saccharomyces paradoxus]QHS72677.1 Plm2 [Saccharomyces paradoxus]